MVAVLLGAGHAAVAEEARDYAFLLLQGKLSDGQGRSPMQGTVVRLHREGRVFEAVTDRTGVFRFENLPVGEYGLELVGADGRGIRGAMELEPAEAGQFRLALTLGRGASSRIGVRPVGARIALEVPDPPTRWRKLWVEMGIFAGVAGLLVF